MFNFISMSIDDRTKDVLDELRLVLPQLEEATGISPIVYNCLSRCVEKTGTRGEKNLLETYYSLGSVNAVVNLVKGLLSRYDI